jgi:hypothetical protein
LHFLGFLWPKWVFSKGYAEKNKKISFTPRNPSWLQKAPDRAILTPVDAVAELSTIEIVITRIIAPIFALRKRRSANS